ncbi:aminotransferase class I/II-fold pyridoxal phosphate-dependent enzyme, partial [Patescibacteria group bacterium]|nr:aminotransferase class I/II-fold pyridoxal phosphate-dependent enzyme [Patescibacteria group bacterium]
MKNAFYHEEKTKKLLCEFIMETNRLSIGPKCEQFEAGFSKYQKRKYAVLYNSGSSANLALIQALLNLGKLNKGDKVGVSALTWATSIMPLIQLGLNPIPIDVSLKNLNVNSENLLNIKDELKVLFITNLLGFCGDIDKIKKICEERGIILLEDTCEALGSELNGIKLGNFGLASTFSFFVGHHLSTIEGGMVCTDDKELYEMLLMVRAYGWNKHLSEEKKAKMREEHGIENNFYDSFTFYFLGYNLRPTEITGFIGVHQLKYIEEICKKRNDNFHQYEKIANENPDFQKLDFSHMNFISNFTYPL